MSQSLSRRASAGFRSWLGRCAPTPVHSETQNVSSMCVSRAVRHREKTFGALDLLGFDSEEDFVYFIYIFIGETGKQREP